MFVDNRLINDDDDLQLASDDELFHIWNVFEDILYYLNECNNCQITQQLFKIRKYVHLYRKQNYNDVIWEFEVPTSKFILRGIHPTPCYHAYFSQKSQFDLNESVDRTDNLLIPTKWLMENIKFSTVVLSNLAWAYVR